MHRSRPTAQELHRRYRQGERNFAGSDLRGASLRGLNLRDIDLSGADLSRTDLRGTNLTDAALIGTQLTEAKTGTRRRWLILQLLIVLILVGLGSLLVGIFWGTFADSIFYPDGSITESVSGHRLFGILAIGMSIGFLALAYVRGLLAALGLSLVAFPVAFASAVAGAFAGTAAIAVAVAFPVASAVTCAFAFAVAFAGAGAVAGTAAGTAAVAGALLNAIVCFLIAKRALRGDPRDQLIRTIAVWFASWGGTKLIEADLTDADFSKAQLKSAHLYRAKLLHTRFHPS